MVHGRSSFLKVFLLVLVMVAVGLAAVAAAKTPAGTVISNQAIAEYKVDGETRRVESNIVYVTVQQVAEVEVKPADTTLVYVVPGQLATIPVTVTNRGNGPDSFTFSPVIAQHPEGGEWDFQPVAGTYRVYIDVNGNGVVDAGDTLYGTHPLENPATFGPVAPDETVSLLVQVRTPVDAAAEEQLGIQVEVESTAGAQGQTGLIILEAVLDGVLTADLSAVSNYPTDTTKVKSDGEITYTVRLTNLGFSTLTGVQVPLNVPAHTEYVAGSLVVNGVPVADPAVDGDGNRIFVTGAINGAQTYTIQYKVVVQNTAEGGSYITNQIEVAYTYGEADRIAQTNEVRTQVLTTYGVELSEPDPAEHDPIQAGGVYSFEFVVTNNGNATDRIYIQTALVQDDTNAPVLWQVELFAANGMTPLPKDGVNYTVGNLPRGESTTFVAKVYVPASELDNTLTYRLDVMAFSMNDTTARDQESGYLKNVEGPKVALAADEDLIETDPGTVVDFSLTVTNLGPMQDVFTLSATTDEAGYEWQFFDVSGNPIGEISVPSGQQRNFTLRVVVPADAKPGEVAFTVKATSQHNAAAFDTETVTLSVGEVINLTIEPNRSGSVNQGGYTTYTLAVWNRGNTDKNITLGTMVPSGGEKRLFYVFVDVDTNAVLGETQSFTVPAGSSQNVKIRVDAPSQISVGTTEVVNVVLKITGSDTILDYATLTTTVTGWELDLNKDVTVGPEGAKPGSQLTYTIKATNISVKGLTEVKVFEKIPAHTTFVSAGGPEGVAIDYVYAEDGVTVTDVTWEIGDMAPDAVVTLTLTVQIQ